MSACLRDETWLMDLMLLAAGTKQTLAGSNKLHHYGELCAEYALVEALAGLKCPEFQATVNHSRGTECGTWLTLALLFVRWPFFCHCFRAS